MKFAQKLGYKGFPALKLAMSESLASPKNNAPVTVHNQILSTDSLHVVGEKLLAEKQAALRATLDINGEPRLKIGLSMLADARKIVLTGIGASGLVAKDLAYKLLKIGVTAIAESDTHVLIATVQALSKKDLLLAISSSGERSEINLAARVARESGAKVLAITGLPQYATHQADHCLYTVADTGYARCRALATTAQYPDRSAVCRAGSEDTEHRRSGSPQRSISKKAGLIRTVHA